MMLSPTTIHKSSQQLKVKELTAIAFRQEDGLVFITLEPGVYRINGKIQTIDETDLTYNYDPGTVRNGRSTPLFGAVINEDVIDKIERVALDNVITHYAYVGSDSSAPRTISTDAYETELARLNSKCTIEKGWETPEDSAAEQNFRYGYSSVRDQQYKFLPVLVEIKNEYGKKHPYLIPMRKLSGNLTDTLYVYQRMRAALALVAANLTQVGYAQRDALSRSDSCFALDSDLRFSKINCVAAPTKSEYLTSNIPELKCFESARDIVGTFEELNEHYENDKRQIEIAAQAFAVRHNPLRDVGAVSISEIKESLGKAMDLVMQMKVMKASQREHGELVRSMANLVSKINEAAASIKK